MNDETAMDIRTAVAALGDGGWQALPALARLDADGHHLTIDVEASRKIGTPVVILKDTVRAPKGLTRRQGQIALAIADGLSNAQIAQKFSLSLATVKDHVHAILQRLGAKRRGEVAKACHRSKT